MPPPPTYALDANVLIQAKDAHYRFGFCPAFWEFLVVAGEAKQALSIDKILAELAAGGDELSNYAHARLGRGFFHNSGGADVVAQFARLVQWVEAQDQFFPSAKADFAAGVDGWLVAYAKAHGLTLVTQEVHAPEAKKKVPIPNVCRAFGVPYCNTFEMLDAIKPQFVLAT